MRNIFVFFFLFAIINIIIINEKRKKKSTWTHIKRNYFSSYCLNVVAVKELSLLFSLTQSVIQFSYSFPNFVFFAFGKRIKQRKIHVYIIQLLCDVAFYVFLMRVSFDTWTWISFACLQNDFIFITKQKRNEMNWAHPISLCQLAGEYCFCWLYAYFNYVQNNV